MLFNEVDTNIETCDNAYGYHEQRAYALMYLLVYLEKC